MQECGEFTLALANKDTMVGADYVGIASSLREPNKIAKMGWTVEKAPDVNAPLFTEFPLTLECHVKEVRDDAT